MAETSTNPLPNWNVIRGCRPLLFAYGNNATDCAKTPTHARLALSYLSPQSCERRYARDNVPVHYDTRLQFVDADGDAIVTCKDGDTVIEAGDIMDIWHRRSDSRLAATSIGKMIPIEPAIESFRLFHASNNYARDAGYPAPVEGMHAV